MMHQEAGSVLIVVMIGLLMTSSRDCGFGFDYFHVVTVAKTNLDLESQRHITISNIFKVFSYVISSDEQDLSFYDNLFILCAFQPYCYSIASAVAARGWTILIIIDIWSMMWPDSRQCLIESLHAWCESWCVIVDSLIDPARKAMESNEMWRLDSESEVQNKALSVVTFYQSQLSHDWRW